MTVQLDHFDVHQKQLYVIIATVLGLVLSHVSTGLRVWAKMTATKKLNREDWLMIVALVLSYGVVVPLLWGLSTGLAQNVSTVSKNKKEMANFLLSVWLIQRFQPPTLFFIKTSIILFYVRLFGTSKFRIAAWVIWAYTLLWTIGAWLASMLECLPVSYFWDKNQKGHCVKNPLINIGLTDGVLSCFGDILIFCMPIPVLRKLKINRRKKYALSAVFAVGILVIATSFIRWIALLGTAVNITSTQAEAGTWTYLEIATGITCGNLPLMAPLFRRLLSLRGAYSSNSANPYLATPSNKIIATTKTVAGSGFERMQESPSGSEVELQDRHRYGEEGVVDSTRRNQIHVQTQVEIKHEESHWTEVDPMDTLPARSPGNSFTR